MMKICKPVVALVTMLATVSTPMFGQGFVTSEPCCAPVREYRLKCQTVYEEKPYTSYRLESQTILEERPVVTYKPVWETEFRERRYTVTRPVAETSMREERRTVMRPVTETKYREVTYQRTRMVAETQSREERRTVMRPVTEVQAREETRVVHKPVTTTRYQDQVRTAMRPETTEHQQVVDRGQYYDQWSFRPTTEKTRNRLQLLPRNWFQNNRTGAVASQRPGAYWVPQDVDKAKGQYQVQRMYVPNPVTQNVTTTTMVPYQYTEKVPVPVTQMQPETQVRRVPVEVTRYVPQEEVRRTPVTVQRPVVEQKVERVPYQVVTWVPQEQRRQVPVTTYKYVSQEQVEQIPVRRMKMEAETRMVQIPKTVSNWVGTTRVRRIPRTMVMRIPIDHDPVLGQEITAYPVESAIQPSATSAYEGVEGFIPGLPVEPPMAAPATVTDTESGGVSGQQSQVPRGSKPELDTAIPSEDAEASSLNGPENPV